MKTPPITVLVLLLAGATFASAEPKAVCDQAKAASLKKELLARAEAVQKEIRSGVAPKLVEIKAEIAFLRQKPDFDDAIAAAAKDYSEITRKTYDRAKSLQSLNKVDSPGFTVPALIMSEETYVKGVESANQIALKVVADEMMAASPSLDASYRARSNAAALKMLRLYADLQYDFMIKRAILTSELGNSHQIPTVQKYAEAASRPLPDGYVDALTRLTAEGRTCREDKRPDVRLHHPGVGGMEG